MFSSHAIFTFQITFLFLTASVLAEPSKVVQKRSGLVGHYGGALISHGIGGYGYGGGLGYAGGYGGFGSGIASGLGLSSGTIVGADVHTTVTKHIGVPVPAPYPVAVDRPVPYPVKVCFNIFRSIIP